MVWPYNYMARRREPLGSKCHLRWRDAANLCWPSRKGTGAWEIPPLLLLSKALWNLLFAEPSWKTEGKGPIEYPGAQSRVERDGEWCVGAKRMHPTCLSYYNLQHT